MVRYWKSAVFSAAFMSILVTGCQGSKDTAATTLPVSTQPPKDKITYETNETQEIIAEAKTKIYRLQTEDNSAMTPCLTLFDDGTFGFTYDILSSYLSFGTYELTDGMLIATTNDKRYQYVFEEGSHGFTFIQSKSSDVSLIDTKIGIPITDGAVFAEEDTIMESMMQMTAVVKEIGEDFLLVSSKTDAYPGTFYVYFDGFDISQIKGGDRIVITWNGIILESEPAQIYADKIECNTEN